MDGINFQELQENSEEFLPRKLFTGVCISPVREAVEQLSILKIINDWPEERNATYKYRTVEQRVNDGNSYLNGKFGEAYNSTVFRKNCVFVKYLLTKLMNELANKGSYEEFKAALEIFQLMKSDEERLLLASSDKEKEVNKLQARLSDEKARFIENILNCMAETGKIKDDIENFQVQGDIKLKYVRAWENSRYEMKDILSAQKNRKQQEKINRTNIDINHEKRVHEEIVLAYTLFEKELATKLEEWKQNYVTEMDKFNEKIDALQVKQDQQLDKIRNMNDLFSKRQKEIEGYKQYKKEQEKLRQEMERNTRAATKIQAWWRGTMVRKGLGKYKKKKEKKVKKKSSEKKSAK